MAESFLSKLNKSDQSIREVKKSVKGYLEKGTYDEIEALFQKDKRALSALIALSYDKQTETSWRAIQQAGKLIAHLANYNYQEARGQVQRLLWNASDESGTIPWSVPEILGEVIRENPEPFEDIVSIIIGMSHSETDDNIFLSGVIYAIGSIGEVHVKYMSDYAYILVREGLLHKDPEVVANAIVAAKKIKLKDIDEKTISTLSERKEIVKCYVNDKLITTTVHELTLQLLGA